MRIINGRIEFKSKKAEWVQLNPYEIIGNSPKEFTARDLFLDEVIKFDDGYIKVTERGGGAFFGKDSYSYMWIKFKEVKRNLKNPNRYYISIKTHNPIEVYHKTLENPKGSKYGGVGFGGWCDTVEECIEKHFPIKYTKEGTDSMYYSKTLKITHIKRTDLETGEITDIKIDDNYNTILNALS